uniref:DoxX family protein n=1 Tax=Candidatus Planktophila sp. TaxID=2175601 RepID=UPI00404AC136
MGQLLFAALFITSGMAHFAKLEAMTGYAQYKKLPAAKLGVMVSGLFFLVGGILIVIGTYVDLGALLIAITLVLAAFIFHNFWKESDANTKMQEQIAFNKDISLAGAALMLFALVNSGVISGSDLFVNIGSISLFN